MLKCLPKITIRHTKSPKYPTQNKNGRSASIWQVPKKKKNRLSESKLDSFNRKLLPLKNSSYFFTSIYFTWDKMELHSKLYSWMKWRSPSPTLKQKITDLGIYHLTPKTTKRKAQNSIVIEQWSNKWSIISPSCLHIQHQSTIVIYSFIRLSTMRVFPKVVVQTKITTFIGTFILRITFQGKYELLG